MVVSVWAVGKYHRSINIHIFQENTYTFIFDRIHSLFLSGFYSIFLHLIYSLFS